MKKYNRISDVANLFDIPVSTLHYWEKEGLFSIHRNEENRYRTYTISDVLNIWEIVLYRELNLSMEEIKNLQVRDGNYLDEIYRGNEEKIDQQIEQLKERKRQIKRQRELISQMHQLQEESWKITKPDFSYCVEDPFTIESIQYSLENPNDCCLYITREEPNMFHRGICYFEENKEQGKEVLWQVQEDTDYVEFLLRVKVDELTENNLAEMEKKVRARGYQPGEVIARYLIIAAEQGIRYEYYRAYMQLLP